MDLKNLITNKAFLFDRYEEKSDGDEVIIKILEKEKYTNIKSIDYLSTNFGFDTFAVDADNKSLIIKYSLDPQSSLLFNEFEFLKNNPSIWKPSPVNYSRIKMGDEIQYSIQTHEFADNVEDIGRGIIWGNIDAFLACYFSLQYHQILPNQTFSDYLKSKLEEYAIDQIPNEAVEAFKETGDFEAVTDLVDSLIREINQLYKPEMMNTNEFVHGNLKLSNILCRDTLFKFINFTYSHRGNSFFDLAALTCCMDLEFEQEKILFHSFIKFQNKNFSIEIWQQYKQCFELYIRLLLLDIITSYLKEVYILESSRPSKINRLLNSFILNSSRFNKIPTYVKYASILYTSILEPLIGSKLD